MIESPIGPLLVEATGDGLVGLWFAADDPTNDTLDNSIAGSVDESPDPTTAIARQGALDGAAVAHLDQAIREIREYMAGQRRRFDVPIDWSRSTGFRRDVLRELYDGVGFGEVITYGELAERVGRPRAARAVGTAMATNPVAVVVPCHRVVRAGRTIGAYGGGVEAKQWLLELEGVLEPDVSA